MHSKYNKAVQHLAFRQLVVDPNRDLRAFRGRYRRLFIQNGMLVLGARTKRQNNFPRTRIVIPKSLISTVLQGVHDSPFAGHL